MNYCEHGENQTPKKRIANSDSQDQRTRTKVCVVKEQSSQGADTVRSYSKTEREVRNLEAQEPTSKIQVCGLIMNDLLHFLVYLNIIA
jgi:hypothetical protein